MKTVTILKKFGAKKDKYGHYYIPLKVGKLLVNLRDNFLFCNFFGAEKEAIVKFGHWKQNIMLTGSKEEKEVQVERHLSKLINI